jgi:adenylosuccinate lyase
MPGLTLIILAYVKGWITDTAAERARLAAATRHADELATRYLAGMAGLEIERQRVRRDAEAEREANLQQLKAAQAAMTERMEEERAKIVVDSLNTAFRLINSGAMDEPKAAEHAKVIDLALARPSERVRERGSVGP